MKPTFIFIILSAILSTIHGQIPEKRVIITGSLLNSDSTTPRVLAVNFLNPFDKKRQSATFNDDMFFSIESGMLFTQNMTVGYNGVFINLYVAPGDSVHLEIDAAKLKLPDFGWLKISGDHAQISTQLNLLHRYIHTLPYHKYNLSLSPTQLLKSIKEDYNRQISIVQDYITKKKADPILMEFFKKDIKYGIANQIADYVDEGNDSTASRQERIALFDDSFFDYPNEANFLTMMYPSYLWFKSKWKIDDLIMDTKPSLTEAATFSFAVKALQQEPMGVCRDYMMFNFLASYLEKNPELYTGVSALDQYFVNPDLSSYVDRYLKRNNHLKVNKNNISVLSYLENGNLINIKNVDFLSFLSKKYPNKIVYLDIFATWCGPCLQEMEYTSALHKKYTGKDIVFVNLCLQSAKENWVKLVRERKIQGENYFIGEADDTKLFMSNFNIRGFPLYMLVDSNGNILSGNAYKPSESIKLEKQIRQYQR